MSTGDGFGLSGKNGASEVTTLRRFKNQFINEVMNSVPNYLLGGGYAKIILNSIFPLIFDFKARFYHIGPTLTLPYCSFKHN